MSELQPAAPPENVGDEFAWKGSEAVKAYIRIRPQQASNEAARGELATLGVDLHEYLVVDDVSASVALFPLSQGDISPNARPSSCLRRVSLLAGRSPDDRLPEPRPRQRSSSVDMLLNAKDMGFPQSFSPVHRHTPEIGKGKPKVFQFDGVMDASSQQEDVWGKVESIVDAAIHGYNGNGPCSSHLTTMPYAFLRCVLLPFVSFSASSLLAGTIFAYGCTGSGKSFTMMGPPSMRNSKRHWTFDDPETTRLAGIIPRAVKHVFERLRSGKSTYKSMSMVRMSYVELYNNQFRDLLAFGSDASKIAGSPRAKIELHENKTMGVYLTGSPSLKTPVTSAERALALIYEGNRHRAQGCTNLNVHSSRSHAVLTLHIEIQDELTKTVKMGKLHLIDLAGSERVSMSGAEGAALVETQNINLSLATLGDVLSKVCF
jgi:hypothetical protein